MPYRVIQWSTGNVGKYALRAIVGHPELELAGLVVSNPDKVGKDAAELCGLDAPTGIVATDDWKSLLANGADCVCYTADAGMRMTEAVDDMAAVLEAGVAPTPGRAYAFDWFGTPLGGALGADPHVHTNMMTRILPRFR